jgi:hypothetical protein
MYFDNCLFDDDNLTEAIQNFRTIIEPATNSSVRIVGLELIRQVQNYNKNRLIKGRIERLTRTIEWVINSIEIVGFMLAIFSVA